MFGQPWQVLIAAIVIGVGSAARLTRLVVNDSWPPVVWIKAQWDKITAEGGWWLLLNCPWCLGPWWTLIVGAWAVIDARLDGVIDWPWWAFNGWLALSYVVSWLVYHDEDGAPDQT